MIIFRKSLLITVLLKNLKKKSESNGLFFFIFKLSIKILCEPLFNSFAGYMEIKYVGIICFYWYLYLSYSHIYMFGFVVCIEFVLKLYKRSFAGTNVLVSVGSSMFFFYPKFRKSLLSWWRFLNGFVMFELWTMGGISTLASKTRSSQKKY